MKNTIAAILLCAAAIGVAAAAPVADAQSRSADHASQRATRHPLVGSRVRALPRGYRTISVNRQSYGYHNGSFYRPRRDGVYVVVRAPLGARVRSLPPGYVSFGIGPRNYFYANWTYYIWDRGTAEYVVVEEPEGAAKALVTASETASGEIFVYPKQGQSDELRNRDRYECYLWASEQTGHDPASSEPDIDKAGDYRRAISACLEGRGYTVK